MDRPDVVVIGGGIAGVSVAAELAPRARVLLLEREPHLALHTTGRSAAQYLENYEGPLVRRLTLASRPFFAHPPDGFADAPLLSPRPLLTFGRADQLDLLEAEVRKGSELVPSIHRIDRQEALRLCPALRPEVVAGAVLEPDALDLDVAAIHQGYVRRARAAGAEIRTSAGVERLDRRGGAWLVTTASGTVEAPLVVDAAGAWAEELAVAAGVAPIGLRPFRRTAFTVPGPPGSKTWPLVHPVDMSFYVKPEAGGQLLCSLADETPSPPCDARPEEEDVALAIERINEATTLDIRYVRSAWAGLRSFVADRNPVVGPDPEADGFAWLAGQGGFGIQTAPALARAAAGLLLDGELPADLRALGIAAADLSPQRCRAA